MPTPPDHAEGPYSIELHRHRFAAWAASRAASVSTCRFTVATGRELLEACGFRAEFATPDMLPSPQAIDQSHREWRQKVIAAAKPHGHVVSHGVAAKLINVYLKSRFVCGGFHDHAHVQALHPPIDSVLLERLWKCNVGGEEAIWRWAAQKRWSRLGPEDYEQLIDRIRTALKGAPLWTIEEHWPGNR